MKGPGVVRICKTPLICLDCGCDVDPNESPEYLCPRCQRAAAQAQRDHRVRDAAHDMLAALEICYDFAQSDDGWRCPQEMHDAIGKAIAKARGKEAQP